MSQKSTQPGRERVGHFTQMVCKASRKVGYGIAIGKSSNCSINTWLVARYTPLETSTVRLRQMLSD